jgi:toxin ParE1/3/4
MAQVRKRASAKQDLIGHFVYLAENASIETAERFLSCAQDSFSDLANNPEMGPLLQVRNPELAGIRKWRVKDFENFLIFYKPDENGITIVRVMHAARDWWTLLGLV